MDPVATRSEVAPARPRAAIERELRALVAHAVPGTRLFFPRRGDRRIWYSWNGRHLRPTGLTIESQLHEVAHLLVAHPSRRALHEFGLGPDPYRRSDATRQIPEHIADREELDACAMQLLLARLLGLSERAIMDEVHAEPLTLQRIRALRRRCPTALPASWWRQALRSEGPPR